MIDNNKKPAADSVYYKRKALFGILDIPSEVVKGVSIATLIGNGELYIENYKCIMRFDENEIRLKVKNGSLCILGEGFHIKYYNDINMYITGNIRKITFEKQP